MKGCSWGEERVSVSGEVQADGLLVGEVLRESSWEEVQVEDHLLGDASREIFNGRYE